MDGLGLARSFLHPRHLRRSVVRPLKEEHVSEIIQEEWPAFGVPNSALKVRGLGRQGLELCDGARVPLLLSVVTYHTWKDCKASLLKIRDKRHFWLLIVPGGVAVVKGLVTQLAAYGAVCPDLLATGWEVVRHVGRGSYGVAFLITKRFCNEPLVAKALVDFPPDEKDEVPHAQIAREVEILVAIQGHPHVLVFHRVMKSFIQGCYVWALLTEFYKLGDLKQYLKGLPLKRCSEEQARGLFRGLFSALEHLHQLGVVHRDVKPDNIFLRSTEHAVLGDFGFATHWTSEDLRGTAGAAGYRAPEVRSGNTYSSKMDIFPMGVSLCVALLGYHPYGTTEEERLSSVQKGPEALQEADFAHCSKVCLPFARRLLTVDPHQRPSASEALLSEWFEGLGPPRCKTERSSTQAMQSSQAMHSSQAKAPVTRGPIREVQAPENPAPCIVPPAAQKVSHGQWLLRTIGHLTGFLRNSARRLAAEEGITFRDPYQGWRHGSMSQVVPAPTSQTGGD